MCPRPQFSGKVLLMSEKKKNMNAIKTGFLKAAIIKLSPTTSSPVFYPKQTRNLPALVLYLKT